MAEDIRQLVRQLGMESVSLVGHDLGGLVAYVYAAQYMDQVLRLGIMEAPIVGVPSLTIERVVARYWHIGLYAHPRLPELLITGGIRGAMSIYRAIANEIPAILKLTNRKLTMPVWAVGGEHSMGIGPSDSFSTSRRQYGAALLPVVDIG